MRFCKLKADDYSSVSSAASGGRPWKSRAKKSFQYMIAIKKGLEAVASRADATVRAKWRAV
jgi:hypothetical protein